jgi:hypothetical protein
MISDRGATIIVYVVLGIWGLGMLASMWPHSTYRMEPTVHGIFTATVVGSLTYRMKKDADKDRQDGGSHRK